MSDIRRIIANNDCYLNEHGTVTGYGKNMIGRSLTYVRLDNGHETCFYAHELTEEDARSAYRITNMGESNTTITCYLTLDQADLIREIARKLADAVDEDWAPGLVITEEK